jgi:group II intron reverse transcriptase/maturase
VIKAKPFDISKQLVWDAYLRVKAKRGAAGVDGQTLEMFSENEKDNLFKIWNRLSSGTYFPPAVKLVEIPKGDGGIRPLGIPTVSDRIAQMVVKMTLEPLVEPKFHEGSYGYRPGKSALDAVGVTRERCWRKGWVIDLDIKGFFDNLNHELVERAVAFHTEIRWVNLYIGRWLRASLQKADGTIEKRTKGTPQGGVISPLLANLFLHYAFDSWISREYPGIQFERYADDIIVHCASEAEARQLLKAICERLLHCGLEVHPVKTKIVYCKDDDRTGDYTNTSFDFLGYTFQARRAKTSWGKLFVNFLPAMSTKAANRVRETIRQWRIPSQRSNQSLEAIAELANPSLRGWLNYYGRYSRSKCVSVLQYFNRTLTTWAGKKYKGLKGRSGAAWHWLAGIAKQNKKLFVLWESGVQPHG